MIRGLITALGLVVLAGRLPAADSNLPPVRIALVNTCGGETVENALGLVSARLSQTNDVALVERSEVERVLREQSLWLCGLSEARQAVAAGFLLDVDVFVAMESFSGTNGLPGVVVFDARSGARLWDTVLTGDRPDTVAAETVQAIRGAIVKRQGSSEGTRTVCLLSVRNVGLPSELNGACEAAGRVLERRLVGSATVTILERARLDQINAERGLPGHGSDDRLRASLTLLEVELGRLPDGQGVSATIFLTDSAGEVVDTVRTNLLQTTPVAAVEALIPDLLKALHAAPITVRMDQTAEAQRFYSESCYLVTEGDALGGLRAAEAAAALDSESQLIDIQLALSLGSRAMEILRPNLGPRLRNGALVPDPQVLRDLTSQGYNDVSGSLPFAERAVGICRQIRLNELAAASPPDPRLMDAENVLAIPGPAFMKRGYWERMLQLYAAQDKETKARLLRLQSELRDLRSRLDLQVFQNQVTNDDRANYFATEICYALHNAGKYVTSGSAWITDVSWMIERWLGVVEQHPLCWGSWYLTDARIPAELCCEAIDSAQRGFNWRNDLNAGYVPRVNDWTLEPEDLQKLDGLFEKMERHPDPILQCYGRIGHLAIRLRDQDGSSPAILQAYQEVREFVRDTIAEPGREPADTYQRLAYCAARDLIDIVPDAVFRKQEYFELFEYMLERRELSYWTVQAVVDPDASRFAQYQTYHVTFPLDSVGYGTNDAPRLLSNGRRALQLFHSTDRQDLDASELSFRRGSFDREVQAMFGKIFTLRPDLRIEEPAILPWTEITTLYQVDDHDQDVRIRNVVTDGTNGYVLVVNRTWAKRGARLVQVPLEGGPAQDKGFLRLESLIYPAFPFPPQMSLGQEAVWVSAGSGGVQCFPLHADAPYKIDASAGLPSDQVNCFAVAGRKLYAMLAQGQLVAYDLETRQCEVLASKRSREKRSPLDEIPNGFQIRWMIHDAPRHRILFDVRVPDPKNCYPPIGLWELRTDTHAIRQLLELYYPVNWMQANGQDRLLIYCRRNQVDAVCQPPFRSVVEYDLTTDEAVMLWSFNDNRDRAAGPSLLSWPSTVHRLMMAEPPMVAMGDRLWMNCLGWGRLSFTTGVFDEFSPPDPVPSTGSGTWHTLRQVNDHQLLAADDSHVWLLTLPQESKDSSR